MDESPDWSDAPTGSSDVSLRTLRESLDREDRLAVETAVDELLSLFERAHALAILAAFAAADGPLRFGELEATTGVAPNTLSARLGELTTAGLVERHAYDETPPRVEYEPTERGRALFPLFTHLYRWATEFER